MAAEFTKSDYIHDIIRRLGYVTGGATRDAANELRRLDALINNPHTDDFLQAVHLEAAHQRDRWGTDHDAGKTDADWFWLIGYLAGKAIRPDATPEKRLHHIITTAAACLNWHAARTGADTRMRPGIEPPYSEKETVSAPKWNGEMERRMDDIGDPSKWRPLDEVIEDLKRPSEGKPAGNSTTGESK